MTRTAFTLGATALLALSACQDRRAPALPPEVLAQRELVMRQACASRELLARAEEDIETLEDTFIGADPDDPFADVIRRASASALEFMHAYYRHAEFRAATLAHRDSAVNHAATGADSARHAQRAASFTLRLPAEGTVEANVLNSYQEAFEAILLDEDHRCNWDY